MKHDYSINQIDFLSCFIILKFYADVDAYCLDQTILFPQAIP